MDKTIDAHRSGMAWSLLLAGPFPLMRSLLLPFAVLLFHSSAAQDSLFTVTGPPGPVAVNEHFFLRWVVRDQVEDWTPPDMRGLRIVAGPSESTSMSNVNGVVSNEHGWMYRVMAERPGRIVVPPMRVRIAGEWISSPPAHILVLHDATAGLRPHSPVHELMVDPRSVLTLAVSADSGYVAGTDGPDHELRWKRLSAAEALRQWQHFTKLAPPQDSAVSFTVLVGIDQPMIQVSGPAGSRNEPLSPQQAARFTKHLHGLIPDADSGAGLFATLEHDGARYVVAEQNDAQLVKDLDPEETRTLEGALRETLATMPPQRVVVVLLPEGTGFIQTEPRFGDASITPLDTRRMKEVERDLRTLLAQP